MTSRKTTIEVLESIIRLCTKYKTMLEQEQALTDVPDDWDWVHGVAPKPMIADQEDTK